MRKGIDDLLRVNREARRASLDQVEAEFAAKGLAISGPRIREAAKRLGQHYEALAHQLFAMALEQESPTAACTNVLASLRREFALCQNELVEVVAKISGGEAAVRSALNILGEARLQVERDAEQFVSEAEYLESKFPAVLATESGEVLTTETGEPIELEGYLERSSRVGEFPTVSSAIYEAAQVNDTANAEVVPARVSSSDWTGQLTKIEQMEVIGRLGPLAQSEIKELVAKVHAQRFNDVLTKDSLEELERLHQMLGELIQAAKTDTPIDRTLAAFGQSRDKFFALLAQGSNIVVAAPALTFGIVKLLSALCGVTADGGLVGAVYAAMLYKLCGKGEE